MKTKRQILLATAAALLLAGVSDLAAAPQYTVTLLGTDLGGKAHGLNNSGQVVGFTRYQDPAPLFTNYSKPFLSTGAVTTDLGTLGGRFGEAYAVNDSGHVVGYTTIAGEATTHAFLHNGAMIDLGLPNGEFRSVAFAINNAGQTFNRATTQNNPESRTYFYNAGVQPNIGTLGGGGTAGFAMNSSGQIVGLSFIAGNAFNHAFSYSGAVISDLTVGSAVGGTTNSIAYAVNDAGEVVGVAQNFPFIHRNGTLTTINHLGRGGVAYAINSTGTAVGGWGNFPGQIFDGGGHAFAHKGSTTTDLGTVGGSFSTAYDINDVGWIVGTSTTTGANNVTHAFIHDGTAIYDVNNLVPASAVIRNIRLSVGNFAPGQFILPPGNLINDWGQIAGWAEWFNGVIWIDRPVLLTPTTPVSTLDSEGTTRTAKVLPGVDYGGLPPTTNPTVGSLGSTVTLLDGNAGAKRTVEISFDVAGNFGGDASDPFSITGTATDIFVIQVTYNEALANAIFGGEANAYLAWKDPNDMAWKNAVLGNSNAGMVALAGFQGDGAYNPATDFVLGNYGVDTVNNTVWAVVDHNSEFGVVGPAPQPTPTPAPDGEPPTVKVKGRESLVVNEPKVELSGTASDTGGVISLAPNSGLLKLVVTIQPKGDRRRTVVMPLTSSRWKLIVRVKKGQTKIQVRVTDVAGNASPTTTIKVTRK